MQKLFKPFYECIVRDEEGASMTEYGVMVALIAAVSIGIVTTLGQDVKRAFTDVSGQMP